MFFNHYKSCFLTTLMFKNDQKTINIDDQKRLKKRSKTSFIEKGGKQGMGSKRVKKHRESFTNHCPLFWSKNGRAKCI